MPLTLCRRAGRGVLASQRRGRHGNGRSTPSARSVYRGGGIHAARHRQRGGVVALTEQPRLREREPQAAHVALPVVPAIGRHQTVTVDRPAVPAVQKPTKFPGSQQAQQAHHRPRHAAAPGVPMPDGAHAHAEVRRSRLAVAQQAAVAQLAKSGRADEPGTPTPWPRAATSRAASSRPARARSGGVWHLTGRLRDGA